jgi:hypothetical protein
MLYLELWHALLHVSTLVLWHALLGALSEYSTELATALACPSPNYLVLWHALLGALACFT